MPAGRRLASIRQGATALSRRFMPVLLSCLLVCDPVLSSEAPLPAAESMPPEVSAAIGCAVGGSTATAMGALLGAENLVNLIAGGVVASSGAVLAFGLFGVMFAKFCELGESVTPSVLYYLGGSVASTERAQPDAAYQLPSQWP